jgi:hypothetical protein
MNGYGDWRFDEDGMDNDLPPLSPRPLKMFESFVSASPTSVIPEVTMAAAPRRSHGSGGDTGNTTSKSAGDELVPRGWITAGRKPCGVRLELFFMAIAILNTCHVAMRFHRNNGFNDPQVPSPVVGDKKTMRSLRNLSVSSSVLVGNATDVVVGLETAGGNLQQLDNISSSPVLGGVPTSQTLPLPASATREVSPTESNTTRVQETKVTNFIENQPLPSLHGLLGYASSTHRPLDVIGDDHDAVQPVVWNGYPTAAQVLSIGNDGDQDSLSSKLFRAGFVVQPMWTSHDGSNDAQGDLFRQSIENVVVSGYFNMKSKYPQEKYLNWMKNLLSIQDAMVIFTEPSMVPFMSSLRQHAVNRTIFVVAQNSSKHLQLDPSTSMEPGLRTNSPSKGDADASYGYWSLPIRHIYRHLDKSTESFARRHLPRLAPVPLDPASNATSDLFWHFQSAVNVEYKRHKGAPLFWIWLSKTWMVNQAISLVKPEAGAAPLFPNAKFFFYSDMGCFRNKRYNGVTLLRHPEAVPPNRLLWMAHHEPNRPKLAPWQHAAARDEDEKKIDEVLWNAKLDERPSFFHSGSQGAGTAQAWQRFHSRFIQVLDRNIKGGGLFIGEDQVLLQQTCLAFTELCAYVRASQVNDNFYFGLRSVIYSGWGNHSTFWYPPAALSS